MRLQQLYYLLVLYQSDTMVDAANKCYVTQPTISKAIKSLEEELGIEILLRGNQRRVAFTEEGENLAEMAKSIIFELETIRSTFSKKKETRLRVSAQHFVHVVDAFSDLITRYEDSDYDFELREVTTKGAISEVESGLASIGIISMATETEREILKYLRDRFLDFHQLGTYAYAVFLSKDHPLAGAKELSLDDLQPYPYICYSQTDSAHSFLEEGIRPDARQIIRVSDRDTIYQILSDHRAYTIGSGVISSRGDDQLMAVPLESSSGIIRIGWIASKDHRVTKLEKEFIDLCQSYIGSSDAKTS